MTKRGKIFLSALILGCNFFWNTSEAAAQLDDNRQPFRLKSTKIARANPTIPPRRRSVEVKRKADLSAQKRVTVSKTPKAPAVRTSDIDILIQPDAKVVMTLQGGKSAPITRTASRAGKAEFNNLQPGKYKISASLENYIEQESQLTINPRESSELDFSLEPIKYQLNIKTNVPDGEVRYAPAKFLGKNADGSLKLEAEGNYCIVKIRDSLAKIEGLKKGYYTIDVFPSANAPEYESVSAAIEPDDIIDEEDETNVEVSEINLAYKISTQTFDASAWTNNDWQLPTGWNLRNMLSTNGISGVALPRNEQYRYYTNFEMTADVRSSDDKTAGFAIRAIDSKNYYLIQIAGAKAAEKLRMTGYLVKNGVPNQLVSINISAFEQVIKAKKSFRVIIRGRENVFEVFIEDKGRPQPLGNVIDRDNNFRKGAVGIAEINSSNFDVGTFTVTASPGR